MNTTQIKNLANYLHQAEKEKKEVIRLTAELSPELTVAEAYRVQEELVKQKLEEGKKIVGPKMGLTSEAKMKQMNVEHPIYGYTFDYMQYQEGEAIPFSNFIHPKVEPEIGFILSKDLEGTNVTAEDVLAATESVFTAVEIIDSRYKDFNFTLPDVIADNTSAAGFILSSTFVKPDTLQLDKVRIELSINGEVQAQGTGDAILGHPANSIAQLVNMLGK